jgi:hypothetical protein
MEGCEGGLKVIRSRVSMYSSFIKVEKLIKNQWQNAVIKYPDLWY